MFSDILKKTLPKETSALVPFFESKNNQSTKQQQDIINTTSRFNISPSLFQRDFLIEVPIDSLSVPLHIFDGSILFNGSSQFNTQNQKIYGIQLPTEILQVGFILDHIHKPSLILQKGVDFIQQDNKLLLNLNPSELPFTVIFKMLDNQTVPHLQIWLHYVQIDNKQLQKVFGNWIHFNTSSTLVGKLIMNTLWDMLQKGFSLFNYKKILCAMTNTEVLNISGVVEDIFIEGDRNIVIVDNQIFTSPISANVLVSIGDKVTPKSNLFDNAIIYTKTDEIPSSFISGIHLGEGLIGSEFSGGILIENTFSRFPGLSEVIVSSKIGAEVLHTLISGGVVYLSGGGLISELDLLVTDQDADYEIIRLFDILPFKGLPETVSAFTQYLNEQIAYQGKSLLDIATDKGHQQPADLNLFDQYRKYALGANSFYTYININTISKDIDLKQIFSYLEKIAPTGTCMLNFFQDAHIVEYTTNNISEDIATFYVSDTTESFDNISDNNTGGLSV